MWGAEMIVYHGSYMEVADPDVYHSRDSVDFGKGFYITLVKEQASKWAARFKRNKGKGFITIYEFITSCRKKENISDYAVVVGGVANDKVFNTIELYFDGLIERKEAIKRLRYEKPNLQICIRGQSIINEFMAYKILSKK